MNAILIKPRNKRMFSKVLEFIKATKVPAKILSKQEEDDEEFIRRIEESMKSGEADKNETEKYFKRYGIQIF